MNGARVTYRDNLYVREVWDPTPPNNEPPGLYSVVGHGYVRYGAELPRFSLHNLGYNDVRNELRSNNIDRQTRMVIKLAMIVEAIRFTSISANIVSTWDRTWDRNDDNAVNFQAYRDIINNWAHLSSGYVQSYMSAPSIESAHSVCTTVAIFVFCAAQQYYAHIRYPSSFGLFSFATLANSESSPFKVMISLGNKMFPANNNGGMLSVPKGWCDEDYSNVALADFNGDGKTDLICDNGFDGKTKTGGHYVLISDGQNVRSPNANIDGRIAIPRGSWCGNILGQQAIWADFNGDGKADLICYENSPADYPGGRIGYHYVLISNGTDAISPNEEEDGKIKVDWCKGPGAKVTWADFNGDGKADLICDQYFYKDGNNVGVTGGHYVLISDGQNVRSPNNNGDGRIATRAGNKGTWCSNSPGQKAFWADFNGDGKADLICYENSPNPHKGYHYVLISNGEDVISPDGNIDSDGCIKRDWCNWSDAKVTWADFNGDGKADVICTYGSDTHKFKFHEVLVSTGTELVSPNNDSNGRIAVNTDMECDHVTWADFDGDSRADLICDLNESGTRYESGTHYVACSNGIDVESLFLVSKICEGGRAYWEYFSNGCSLDLLCYTGPATVHDPVYDTVSKDDKDEL